MANHAEYTLPDFEFIEHTSDIYVRSYGKNLKQALVNAGKGLMAILVRNPETIEKSEDRKIRIKSKDVGELVYLWLEELIFRFDSETFLFKAFSGELKKEDTGYLLTGILRGEKFNPSKHTPGVQVKGVTYHDMDVKVREGRATITVLLDI